MSTFETAFVAWLAFISNLGANIESQLLPPADKADIEELSATVGYKLPEDFVALYLIANGQLDPYWSDQSFTGTFSPLFGNYELIPIEKILSEYADLADMHKEFPPEEHRVDVRIGDPVAAAAWQPGWVPFAVSNAAYYAVDLTPLRGGTYGQVIEFGHDTVENRVLAASISEFLVLAAANLDPNEPHRYDYTEADPNSMGGRNFSSLFFDMDWTRTPEAPTDYTDYKPDPAWETWNDDNQAAVDAFADWLGGRGFSLADQEIFKRWTFEMRMPMSMKMGGLLSSPMPDDSIMQIQMKPNPVYELASLELALRESTNYIVEDLPVTLEEAFTLLHQYRLEMGVWNQQQYDAADKIIKRDRPARQSFADDGVHAKLTSVDIQADGSLLLCTHTFTDGEGDVKDCEVFNPEL